MISIVIPTYNNAPHIREAIDSALAQQGVDVEVVVVDDGSTDETPEILTEYVNKIQVFRQENQGPGTARNMGWKNSRGSNILFLDADDTLIPNALAAYSKCLSQLPERSILCGMAMQNSLQNELNPSRFQPKYLPSTKLKTTDLIRHSPLTPCPLHPRKALEEVSGWREPPPYLADEFDLHLREHLRGWDFVFQPIPCFTYRQHNSPRISTRIYTLQEMDIHLNRLKHLLQLVQKHQGGDLSGECAIVFQELFWNAGRFALRCGATHAAQGFLNQAHQLVPGTIPGNFLYRQLAHIFGPTATEKLLSYHHRALSR